MRVWLVENLRLLRAVVAICAAMTLAGVLMVHQGNQHAARETAILAVNETLWRLSELFFETQRLSADLVAYQDDRRAKSDVELRFDVLWSRVDLLLEAEFGRDLQFDTMLRRYAEFLEQEEPLIYEAESIPDEEVFRMVGNLGALVAETRAAWTRAFSGERVGMRFADLRHHSDSPVTGIVIALLVGLLMLYVLTELYLAGRAQRVERALREAAASANAAKTRFLANVSHEVRTPLNGILGMATVLAETELTPEQADCVRVIDQSGGVLLSTINDVLDLSRVEAGELHVEIRPYVLRDLVAASVELYAATAREKGLNLTCEVAEDLPEAVQGDARRLRQVLHNLIANAVKFTAEGGVSVRAGAANGRLRIAVEDTGQGVPPDARERIFEPFGQADASVTRQHGGTGLGLTISRQLCQAMGGGLWLGPGDECGATFICDLPLQPAEIAQEGAVEAGEGAGPDLAGLRLLVADDNATNRKILARFLEPAGAQVDFAETGLAAVQRSLGIRYDAILMDIQMPEMDGMAASREIRRREVQAGLPPVRIVAVTANALPHQVAEYRRAGMDEVLVKPLSKRKLLRAVLPGPSPLAA
ncbi:ATP-binding protein [Allosediminivita pacifica]|uniref:Sensory/regulatory protein RpfC n=1 Tax=Allosediminivita pacifica TaxID=1267769 RepID=A0A2T6AD48_9RHOB|nr:ATP-binding protein [Allosediminivita pacifica]PTX41745.1 signal transduction histidine kinase [Allosediminivita pacifica]GGB22858.1 hypothetical protein GCM10011324_36110 [Allosediminivita pacifica]